MANPAVVSNLRDKIAAHLEAIQAMFTPGCVLTIVIRNPQVQGDADIVMGDDALEEAAAAIEQAKQKAPVTP